MSWLAASLRVGPWVFVLQDAGGGAPGRRRAFDGRPIDAVFWLRRALGAPGAGATLRRFLAERTTAEVAVLDDDDVVQRLATLLASGRVEIVERPAVDLSGSGEAGEAAEGEAPSPAAALAAAPRTWITIELVGEDDQPIAGARYWVELPDGSVREGSLDGRGLARFFEIEPGRCVVTFPGLDQDAWTPIGTTGEP